MKRGALKSKSGQIDGIRTKCGSFLTRTCQTVMFYPTCESDYNDVLDLASEAGAILAVDNSPGYCELEFKKSY